MVRPDRFDFKVVYYLKDFSNKYPLKNHDVKGKTP